MLSFSDLMGPYCVQSTAIVLSLDQYCYPAGVQ